MIEIPGYKILRQIGRGGMATVYLAIQESVDREVALKVMSPSLMSDPNFGERFLREARIAAKLHHRHVVGVHDVGKYKDIHFIAMEYLPGGSFHVDEGQPRAPTLVLRVVREIAAALAYAHSKGFVHRDVKPDNILLHDDGAAALTDFGIARASDSATRMTRTGAVIGTPHYMSPEQARGRPLDGRADLYSLGIVLFELLTGKVPFIGEDSLSVGIMHITEPVPRLPAPLVPIQPILDRLLAKLPEDRFQSGDEVAAAIHELECDIAEGRWPELAQPDDGYRRRVLVAGLATDAIRSLRTPTEPIRQRTEPMLGRVEEVTRLDHRPLAPASVQRAAAARAAGQRRWPVWLAAVLALLALGLWLGQDRLRAWLPDSAIASSLARADAARAAGQLLDGDQSARALYEAVLRLDPDNEQARQGSRAVGEAALAKGNEMLGRDDLPAARQWAQGARVILQGGSALEALEQRLLSVENQHIKVDDLLTRAQAAQLAGTWAGANGSVDLFQRVLAADADNAIARKGLQDVLSGLSKQAAAAIDSGGLALAASLIEQIAGVNDHWSELPDLRARLTVARAESLEGLERDISRAKDYLQAGALTSPQPDNALAVFRSVLARDPQNLSAQTGIRQIAGRLLEQARAAFRDRKQDQARRLLQDARALDPQLKGWQSLQNSLRDVDEKLAIAAEQRPLDGAQKAQVQTLLDAAALFAAHGDLIDPPGANAYDKYRSVQALDRYNAEANAGIQALPGRAKSLFQQALGAGRLTAAAANLDVVQQLADRDPALANMRQGLAAAWLKQGLAHLAAGKTAPAAKALANARKLQPDLPGLDAAEAALPKQ
ncbi:MAG: hypothetical protein COS34_00680 [Lysobacterales bacterium CG02_land_8_20_14_3_00_62_12]|nr:MAG: hypothetical protein COS34_00680 [Xanthomonadales bacterium CG02_land_8_20_14_3_00_62_12]